eukprot:COSAG01_NODE_785_length_13619_cov_42.075222_7_plen_297_part_00
MTPQPSSPSSCFCTSMYPFFPTPPDVTPWEPPPKGAGARLVVEVAAVRAGGRYPQMPLRRSAEQLHSRRRPPPPASALASASASAPPAPRRKGRQPQTSSGEQSELSSTCHHHHHIKLMKTRSHVTGIPLQLHPGYLRSRSCIQSAAPRPRAAGPYPRPPSRGTAGSCAGRCCRAAPSTPRPRCRRPRPSTPPTPRVGPAGLHRRSSGWLPRLSTSHRWWRRSGCGSGRRRRRSSRCRPAPAAAETAPRRRSALASRGTLLTRRARNALDTATQYTHINDSPRQLGFHAWFMYPFT